MADVRRAALGKGPGGKRLRERPEPKRPEPKRPKIKRNDVTRPEPRRPSPLPTAVAIPSPGPGPAFAAPSAGRGTIAGLDRRSAEKLRRGRMEIDARIDLHGMTQAQAHAALNRFLSGTHSAGARCVLVITGKGAPRGEAEPGIMPDRSRGVLRAMVPQWLGEPENRARIVAVQPAQLRHGGGGALYVLLRRHRQGGRGS